MSVENNNNDVDELIGDITEVIVSAGDMTLPKKTFKKKKKKKQYKLYKKMVRQRLLCDVERGEIF